MAACIHLHMKMEPCTGLAEIGDAKKRGWLVLDRPVIGEAGLSQSHQSPSCFACSLFSKARNYFPKILLSRDLLNIPIQRNSIARNTQHGIQNFRSNSSSSFQTKSSSSSCTKTQLCQSCHHQTGCLAVNQSCCCSNPATDSWCQDY